MIVDVLVIGAGPAGCAAAARLRGDGAKVALAHRPSVNQRRSESLPAVAVRALAGAGLDPVDTLFEGRCSGTLSAWGSDQLVASDGFATPDGPGRWVDRDRFDAALRRRCVSLGVTVVGQVHDLRRVGTRWAARSAHGQQVSASWVIDATGRAAAIARRLGAARQTGPPLAAVHARTTTPRDRPPARIFLEAEADGWWYVGASSQCRLSAVAVIEPVDVRQLRSREHFVTRLGALPNLGRFAHPRTDWSAPRVSPAGGGWLDAVWGQGWIACGDAALAFDPLSSQGLLGALASGVAAAEAISSDDTAAALADIQARHGDVLTIYEARRSAAYAREHRWAQRPFWSSQRGRRSPEAALSTRSGSVGGNTAQTHHRALDGDNHDVVLFT
jgi:flavin-dependent dehydrogenase